MFIKYSWYEYMIINRNTTTNFNNLGLTWRIWSAISNYTIPASFYCKTANAFSYFPVEPTLQVEFIWSNLGILESRQITQYLLLLYCFKIQQTDLFSHMIIQMYIRYTIYTFHQWLSITALKIRPFFPSTTISSAHPTLSLTITGNPLFNASSTTNPHGSDNEGNTKTSAFW